MITHDKIFLADLFSHQPMLFAQNAKIMQTREFIFILFLNCDSFLYLWFRNEIFESMQKCIEKFRSLQNYQEALIWMMTAAGKCYMGTKVVMSQDIRYDDMLCWTFLLCNFFNGSLSESFLAPTPPTLISPCNEDLNATKLIA